jgi:hypothetical protein
MRSSISSILVTSVCLRGVLSLVPRFDTSSFKSDDIIVRDVAIIGGGSSGTHAAISLKDKGKSVVVIEQKGRLGGHTETYTDPATNIPQDYGVLIFHNISSVRNYFNRFNIPLAANSFAGPARTDYNLRTGERINVTQPSNEAVGAAFAKYAGILAQYPQLDQGMFLPSPVPEDLSMPFGDFVTKYGLEALVPTMFATNQGAGNFLTAPMVENERVNGLSLVQQISTNGYITTARHNNSELYGKAQAELLSANSLLLSSEVIQSVRTDIGVELVVKTPTGPKLILAKKLLITIPPRLEFLQPFSLESQERSVFSKFLNTGYYVGLLKNTGIPSDVSIFNSALDTPYNLPPLPGAYVIQATAIPGVISIYYGSPQSKDTLPIPDATIKADMIASLKKLQAANPGTFNATEPEFVVYTSHAPFYLQATEEDVETGIYDQLNALQGLRSTFWSGAAFRAQDSSMLWKFNEEIVLPMVLKGL